ncbi:hypothetical protein O181_052835 [Austropuccinia psidii MF-1]|uniref:Retroviral polymerase SH3-like domain-containing protein n=1 Tax=Austropuccinia psidii MF-1 TaxID=1389203 RepID=A0A9Q3DZK4_9BASI|nr:hypothetical protein [Austropuccinia psidii MF-1]
MIRKHECLSHSGTEKGCEACHLGKETRSQFKNKNECNTDPIDLMGPITPTSLGGSKYVLVAVDTGSCFSWNSYKRRLDERSEKGVLVGYEQEFGVYQVLLDNSSKIIRTRDVSFVQKKNPYKIAQLPEKTQSQNADDSDYPIKPAKNQLAEELIPTRESNQLTEERQPIIVRLCIPNTQNETRNNEEVIQINQSHYIEELLKKYNMEDCKVTLTPMQRNLKLKAATEAEKDEFKTLNENYRSAIGSLNYLSQCTRPDVAYAVGHLSQLLEKPSCQHWASLKRVLRYLKGTKDLGINYHKTGENEIVGYSDSSWAEDLGQRSWSGYIFTMSGGIISWRSKKLGGVSGSSIEAKFRLFLYSFHEAKWLSLLQSEVTHEEREQTTIYNDNQGAISRAKIQSITQGLKTLMFITIALEIL